MKFFENSLTNPVGESSFSHPSAIGKNLRMEFRDAAKLHIDDNECEPERGEKEL